MTAILFLATLGGCTDEAEILEGAEGASGIGPFDGLECHGESCACSNGVDDDDDGRIDAEDVHCVSPWDDDESSWATGIPGDDEAENDLECFFDGSSGHENDCPTPNGCDCQGCCDIDLDGDGVRERVLLRAACDFAPAGAAPGANGGACLGDGACDDGLTCLAGRFCSTCVPCDWSGGRSCDPRPCESGEVCVGDEPRALCPDGPACLNHDDCQTLGEEFWCQTGCCIEI
jgi:hypothetical protein